MKPEELLNLQVEEFNKGNVSFLMTLYENDACFASEPGQVVKDLESIRQSLQRFIDMRAKLEARVKRVLQAGDLAILITEWSMNGTESDGKPINLSGRGTVVLRQQKKQQQHSDGVTWRIVIENPWGTE
jgi:ketosteroid isomerase-like protein